MGVTKVIKFYWFKPIPSLANNGITPMPMKDILKTVFPKSKSYDIIYDKDKYIIDIIEMTDNFLFGKCAKEHELRFTNLYQTRDKHTGEAFPYSSASPDTQLEVYTYFYIDYAQERMAAIQHKNITKIHNILSEGVWELSNNTLKVFVAPERIKNIKKAAKKLKKNKRLSVAFAPNAISKYNINTLANCLGNINYDAFSVDIKLAQTSDESTIDEIYDNYEKDKDNNFFTGFKLIGKNDSGLEETVDFIETLFTHSASFDITEDIIKNSEIIKSELAKSLYLQQ